MVVKQTWIYFRLFSNKNIQYSRTNNNKHYLISIAIHNNEIVYLKTNLYSDKQIREILHLVSIKLKQKNKYNYKELIENWKLYG